MKYLVTDCQGRRLAGCPFADRAEARKAAREHLKAGGLPIMVYFADDAGNMLGYSGKDTAAASAKGRA